MDDYSVKVEVFEPKDLQVGDVFTVSQGTNALSIGFHGAVDGGTEWATLYDKHMTTIVAVRPEQNSTCWPALFHRDNLNGHITRVVRAGVQIFPKPVPKFKVGDWRQFRNGSRVQIVEVRTTQVLYKHVEGNSKGANGLLSHEEFEHYTVPCDQFMPGDVVAWHKTNVLIFQIDAHDDVQPIGIATLDGKKHVGWVTPDDLTLITPAPVKEAK